jgi:integrase
MPWDRRTRLAIKFALVTMLRSGELLPIHRDELNTENGTVERHLDFGTDRVRFCSSCAVTRFIPSS